jgi:diadenosine tetraphosphatase ApaH/serine/threonine PP2A family protein phosphatase
MKLPNYTVQKPAIKLKIMELLPDIIDTFNNESAILDIDNEPVLIVGDIHGNYKALEIILSQREKFKVKKILFLGDYVDRGSHSAEVILKLFQMKLAEREDVLLLRGNHEDAQMNIYYGFYEEMGLDKAFMNSMQCIYESMPIAAVLDNEVFCVHGGVNGDETLSMITKEDPYHYLWNDPSNMRGLMPSDRGDDIFEFGQDRCEMFLERNKLSMIVRAHEFLKCGYRWWFDNQLLSLFSSTNYTGKISNGAFALYDHGKFLMYVFNENEKIEECV